MGRNGANGREVACGLLVMVCVLVMMGRGWAQGSEPRQNPGQNPTQNSGQSPGRELPDAPGVSKKKEQSGNPVVMTRDAATAGLKKARDWESGWIAGEYMGRNRKLVSPTREQREEIYLRQTLTTP